MEKEHYEVDLNDLIDYFTAQLSNQKLFKF